MITEDVAEFMQDNVILMPSHVFLLEEDRVSIPQSKPQPERAGNLDRVRVQLDGTTSCLTESVAKFPDVQGCGYVELAQEATALPSQLPFPSDYSKRGNHRTSSWQCRRAGPKRKNIASATGTVPPVQQILTAPRLLTGRPDRHFSPGALLIDGGTIAAVGTPSEVEYQASPKADRYDYPNSTILPGLINCHVHLAFDASPDPVGALRAVPDGELLEAMHERAHQHLRAGVTTVRDLGDRGGLLVRLRDAIARGETVGPRILVSGAPLTPRGGHCWFLGGEVDSDAEIRARVRHDAQVGSDLIKVMGNGGQMTPGGPGMTDAQFTPEQLRLIISAARSVGLPTAIHAYTTGTIAAAVAAGVATVEHCTFLGDDGAAALDDDLADRMAAEGIAASPALPSGWRRMWDMLGPERAEAIADRLRWLRHHEVPLLFGSDAGVPISQHGDPVSTLELYEHIGVAHADIIQLATTTSARFLGLGEITGELRPGLDADVVVVDGDPLRDVQSLRHLRRVLRAGREPDGNS